jgi:hypothetical protein
MPKNNFHKSSIKGDDLFTEFLKGAGITQEETFVSEGLVRVIQNWGEQLAAEMRINLLKHKPQVKASGRLLSSIAAPLKINSPTSYTSEIVAEDYAEFVDAGRPPTRTKGNGQLYRSIQEWIVEKRIKDNKGRKYTSRKQEVNSLAAAISKSIHRKGYKGKPFIVPALKKVSVQILTERIEKYISEELS